jgi:hypothetical protein
MAGGVHVSINIIIMLNKYVAKKKIIDLILPTTIFSSVSKNF